MYFIMQMNTQDDRTSGDVYTSPFLKDQSYNLSIYLNLSI